MPKAKRFTAQKERPGAKSTHVERARIREIEQSRTGFEVERSRIKTKYRTRLTRIKQNLERQVNLGTISANEQEERVGAMTDQLNKEKEEELEAMAYEWYQLAYATEMEAESDFSKEQEMKEGVKGDDDNDNDEEEEEDDDDDCDDNGYDDGDDGDDNWVEKRGKFSGLSEDCANNSEYDSNEEDLSDSEFEDGDVDVSDNELLFDDNGDASRNAKDDLANGLQAIIQKHKVRLGKKLEKYINLSEPEVENIGKSEKA
jgi:hypothetical protein